MYYIDYNLVKMFQYCYKIIIIVSKLSAVAPSNITVLPWPNTTDEPNTVKPVDDSILLEPAGFNVVTPAAKGPTTFKLSFTSIWVESVERIELPET